MCAIGAHGIGSERPCPRIHDCGVMRRSPPLMFALDDELRCTERKWCFAPNQAESVCYTSIHERKEMFQDETTSMEVAGSSIHPSFHLLSRSIPENPAEMNLHVLNKAEKYTSYLPSDPDDVLENSFFTCTGEDEFDTGLPPQPECSESCEWEKLSLEQALHQMSNVYAADNYVERCVSLLQKCKRSGCLSAANHAYAQLCENGLDVHGVLGSYLVAMFVHCWSLSMAQQVFSRLLHQNQYSWTNLMQGYIEEGDPEHGLHLYANMKEDGIWPNKFTYVLALRACTALKCIKRGQQLHTEIVWDLEEDPCVARALLDFYVKCGLFSDALDVFDDLQGISNFSEDDFTALCSNYDLFEDTAHCVNGSPASQVPSNALAYVFALKACSSMRALPQGYELHIQIVKKGLDQHHYVSNTLIDMYAKCGLRLETWKILNLIAERDVVSWTALITGCVENGFCKDALAFLELMEKEGVPPNVFTVVSCLRACGITQVLDTGRKLHALIMKEGLYTDFVICNSVVDMYAKCGSLEEAHDVFDKFARRDIISWTSLISGYSDHGLYKEAIDCFKSMEAAGVPPNTVAYTCCLKACAFAANVDVGHKLHNDLVKEEFETHTIIGNALVHMYARCGLYLDARVIFDELPGRDVISWTVLIAEFARDGQSEQALKMLEQMLDEGLSPGSHTYVCSLKACGITGAIERGRLLHMEIIKRGLERSPFIIKALFIMYSECGKPITLS